ncbi:MAG: tRNA (cytidine(34)-2'-O)-methyltransferase [Lachnospiraceae bacterium]|uniref:Putative tRNA (cytidine(34)-2'-O)-methyltransferase n=1 Tax=Candidatus Weimeria bifida TaxID=2599074 RepID=A0A6N7J299_9FIRM|nr:tRNA (cytidine(34)-2'-O)-methyltransferase [Candidatus Weimeria bifida]RRF95882.1 MAG: tRNA (cytidine(34)-2'-O)-methyltransferase [Lachnospiraceae bacterium]
MLNVVLHEPEIPFNTGAIGRTCVATGSSLHLIYPLGFILNDKNVKRAGMDYWDKLDLHEYNDYEDFLKQHPEITYNGEGDDGPKLWFATTKARQCYSDVRFGPDDFLMFGKESAGIPEEILVKHPKACVRIPMLGDTRSLNLSNSAAIVIYEALRQNDFMGLNEKGNLHHLSWD